MPSDSIELTAIERSAIITSVLVSGGTVTPIEVAQIAQCTLRNAYYILNRLARVLPIRDEDGKWFAVSQYD